MIKRVDFLVNYKEKERANYIENMAIIATKLNEAIDRLNEMEKKPEGPRPKRYVCTACGYGRCTIEGFIPPVHLCASGQVINARFKEE